MAFSAFGGLGATLFCCLESGSSDTSSLYQDAEVRPQWDQGHIPRVHWWRSLYHICPSPRGLSPRKVGDDIAKAVGAWKGLRITLKLTVQTRQTQGKVVPSASVPIIKTLKDRKENSSTEAMPLLMRLLARELYGLPCLMAVTLITSIVVQWNYLLVKNYKGVFPLMFQLKIIWQQQQKDVISAPHITKISLRQ